MVAWVWWRLEAGSDPTCKPVKCNELGHQEESCCLGLRVLFTNSFSYIYAGTFKEGGRSCLRAGVCSGRVRYLQCMPSFVFKRYCQGGEKFGRKFEINRIEVLMFVNEVEFRKRLIESGDEFQDYSNQKFCWGEFEITRIERNCYGASLEGGLSLAIFFRTYASSSDGLSLEETFGSLYGRCLEPGFGAAALSRVWSSSFRPKRGDIRERDVLAAFLALEWIRLVVEATDWRDGWRRILLILRLALELMD